jgi:Ca2+-binding RTX toxin-like protein
VQGTAVTKSETIYGGSGTDTVDYSLRTNVITVTYNQILALNDGEAGATEKDAINDDVDIVNGGSGNDSLSAFGQLVSEGSVTLNGNAGNDTLVGSVQATYMLAGVSTRTKDKLNGGAGDDTFDGTSLVDDGDDAIDGGLGTDTVSYALRSAGVTVDMTKTGGATALLTEADTYSATTENIIGSTHADSITGNALGNVITGNGGGDSLFGGAGADIFDQGTTATALDIIDGGADIDTVDYSKRTLALVVDLTSATPTCGETVATEKDQLVIASTGFNTVENVWGSTTAANTLKGDGNANELTGGSAVDSIDGGAGNDTIQSAKAGSTVVCGLGEDILLQSGATLTAQPTDCEVIMP